MLRLPEFDHPTLAAKQFSRACEPVRPEDFAYRIRKEPIVFPADDLDERDELACDHIRFDDSEQTLHTAHIPAERDCDFDATPRILLNAGTHGDEHESMNALASLVRAKELAPEFSYDVIFCSPGMMMTTRMLLGHANATLRIETGQTLAPASRVATQKLVVLSALKAMLENPQHFETPQLTDANLDTIRAYFRNVGHMDTVDDTKRRAVSIFP